METITQTSFTTTTANIAQSFDAGAYTITANTSIVNDAIDTINLSALPKDQSTEEIPMPNVNRWATPIFYASSTWSARGETSYSFVDAVPTAQRVELINAFDEVLTRIKTTGE